MAIADDLKKMSPKMKVLLIGVVFLLILAAYWFYLFQPALEERIALQTKLAVVEKEVEEKQKIADQRDRFVKEIKLLKEAFLLALTKLPDQREIPGLFHAVSVAGKDAGMDFLLFEPKPPDKAQPKPSDVKANLKPSDQRSEQKPSGDPKVASAPAAEDKFYEETPVTVRLTGGFNNAVFFFDKVAKLPRIINIEQVAMGEGKKVAGKGWAINTSCIVKTYMFLEKKTDKTPKADEKKK